MSTGTDQNSNHSMWRNSRRNNTSSSSQLDSSSFNIRSQLQLSQGLPSSGEDREQLRADIRNQVQQAIQRMWPTVDTPFRPFGNSTSRPPISGEEEEATTRRFGFNTRRPLTRNTNRPLKRTTTVSHTTLSLPHTIQTTATTTATSAKTPSTGVPTPTITPTPTLTPTTQFTSSLSPDSTPSTNETSISNSSKTTEDRIIPTSRRTIPTTPKTTNRHSSTSANHNMDKQGLKGSMTTTLPLESSTQVSQATISTIAIILGVIAAILLIVVIIAVYFGICRRRKYKSIRRGKRWLSIQLRLQRSAAGPGMNNNMSLVRVDNQAMGGVLGGAAFSNDDYDKASTVVISDDYLSPTYQGIPSILAPVHPTQQHHTNIAVISQQLPVESADYQAIPDLIPQYQDLEPCTRSLPQVYRTESSPLQDQLRYQTMLNSGLDAHFYAQKEDATYYYEDPDKAVRPQSQLSQDPENTVYTAIGSESTGYARTDDLYRLADDPGYEVAGSTSTTPYQTIDHEYDHPADAYNDRLRRGSVQSRARGPDSIYEVIREHENS